MNCTDHVRAPVFTVYNMRVRIIESVLCIVQWQGNRNDSEVYLLLEARATFPEKGGQRESDKHIHYRLCAKKIGYTIH